MPSPLAAALFDIDGTLVDTSELIRRAVTQTLEEEGITPTEEEMKLGWTMRAVDRMQVWVRERAHAEELAARYQQRYLEWHDALAREYAGMTDTLRELTTRGIALGVVTSKFRRPALRTLQAFGYDRTFPIIITEEDVAVPKPDPEALLLAAHRLGAAPAETVMVGDGAVDLRAGTAAGMRTVGALWGTIDPEGLRAVRPTWLLERPGELLALPWVSPAARGERGS